MDGTQADNPWIGQEITHGPWKGWRGYERDPFENLTGPFYNRTDEAGDFVCAFRAERRHMNASGALHGGAMITFADYAIFIIAGDALAGGGSVTASLNCDLVGAAEEGELIEARGDVVRAGGSLVFVRGVATAEGRPILSFSAIIKKTRAR